MRMMTALLTTSALVALSGCTSDTPDGREGNEADHGSTPQASAAPLELDADEGTGTLCFGKHAQVQDDLAWTATQIRVLEDLEDVKVDIEGEGVRSKRAFIVRPTNAGGRINHSGVVSWPTRRDLVDNRQYAADAAFDETDVWWAPAEGENVQVIMRLQLDDAVRDGDATARITAVTASWQGQDPDDSGTVRASVDEHWAVGAGCGDLPEVE